MSIQTHAGDFAPPAVIKGWQKRALTIAVPAGVLAVAGWVVTLLQPESSVFYQAYLLGYMWILGLALGSLALLMTWHTTGGAWGTVIRRHLEAAARTLWVVAIAFAPIVMGAHRLYPWAQSEWLAQHPEVQRIAPAYLNVKLFLLRALVYFGCWIGWTRWLIRQSDRQDRENTVQHSTLRHVSAAGLVVYTLSITFASIDWVMSLSAPWTSTIYGMLYMAGQGLIALSFAAVVMAALVRYEPMKGVVKPDQFLDYGKLMLAFTMLWGWFTLSQWLIIWAGNLPDEISWYLDRSSPGWHAYSWFIVACQFFIPFSILLSRGVKSDPRKLQKIAIFIIAVRYWDLFWYIMPNFHRQSWGYSWQYAVTPAAMLSGWLALYFHYLQQRPLLALRDDHSKVLWEEEEHAGVR